MAGSCPGDTRWMNLLTWSARPDVAPRGRVLLIHGLTSLAESWWRIGPQLGRRGWDVTAVQQAGHGGRPAPAELSTAALADAVLELYPDGPDVLIGHSLGTITALAILERHPGWAGTVILEEPPRGLVPGQAHQVAGAVAASLLARAAAVQHDRAAVERHVRADCPGWAPDDVLWAVEGIARMDAGAFARWLAEAPDIDAVQQVLTVSPVPFVLAALSPKGFLDGGSALPEADRRHLAEALPPKHLVTIDGGHCLHRDAPGHWLAAFDRITG